mmetsp:Transcript_3148/g.9472  ORF Transcript_3148/g.9472 Transcript_3148/m.9472 type:complete len:203 (+) Transcript_3148:810-1418(+)
MCRQCCYSRRRTSTASRGGAGGARGRSGSCSSSGRRTKRTSRRTLHTLQRSPDKFVLDTQRGSPRREGEAHGQDTPCNSSRMGQGRHRNSRRKVHMRREGCLGSGQRRSSWHTCRSRGTALPRMTRSLPTSARRTWSKSSRKAHTAASPDWGTAQRGSRRGTRLLREMACRQSRCSWCSCCRCQSSPCTSCCTPRKGPSEDA